jgi:hypothetical protein
MATTEMTQAEKQRWFDWFDDIRESGVMNMLMAPKFLADEFAGEIDYKTAKELFVEWSHL